VGGHVLKQRRGLVDLIGPLQGRVGLHERLEGVVEGRALVLLGGDEGLEAIQPPARRQLQDRGGVVLLLSGASLDPQHPSGAGDVDVGLTG
jgi:hypothetical protein